jgi:hypothetical protein
MPKERKRPEENPRIILDLLGISLKKLYEMLKNERESPGPYEAALDKILDESKRRFSLRKIIENKRSIGGKRLG